MATEGRPPKTVSEMIDDEIQFYFTSGIDEMQVVARTHHTWRTVHSRYAKWNKLLTERKNKSFIEGQDQAKERALAALDKQIVELLALQQITIAEVAKLDLKDPTFEQSKGEIRKGLAWMIFDLLDRKSALKLMPSVAEKVKQEVKELIDKYQRQPLTKEQRRDSK